jgi:hypothetical protein
MTLPCAVFVRVRFQLFVIVAGLVCSIGPVFGQTNNWIGSASGHWEDASWSLGIPPTASQSVFIANAGFKAVAISPTTPVNFPGTMTVSNLVVSAPDGAQNTLLLNFSGTAVPLHVLNDCTISSNGSIVSLYSSIRVEHNLLITTNASFVQEGGVTIATNAAFVDNGGLVAVTNATVMLPSLAYVSSAGHFIQSGGSVSGQFIVGSGSTFDFYSGLLSGEIWLGNFGSGYFNEYGGQVMLTGLNITDGTFSQYSGVVTNQGLRVGGFNYGQFGRYSLGSGTLWSDSVSIGNGSFYQSNGVHTVAGGINVVGFFDDYGPPFFSNYTLQNGFLNCASISQGVFGSFSQINGTNHVSGDLSLDETSYWLSGGTLMTSNTIVYPGRLVAEDAFIPTDFLQNAGLHVVSNTLSCFGHYHLDAGRLSVPVVVLSGILDFGPSPGAAISNGVSFELGGVIQLSSSTQHLAAATLFRDSVINFTSGNSQLIFANSSGKVWFTGATLTISNWNGSASGGGADQLFFGNTGTGLTQNQLGQIRFVNPAGFPAGTWFADILPTGEIVATQHPTLIGSLSGANFLVQWPSNTGYVLQSATNPAGLFEDVPNATDPFTNTPGQFPSRFFRLRHP